MRPCTLSSLSLLVQPQDLVPHQDTRVLYLGFFGCACGEYWTPSYLSAYFTPSPLRSTPLAIIKLQHTLCVSRDMLHATDTWHTTAILWAFPMSLYVPCCSISPILSFADEIPPLPHWATTSTVFPTSSLNHAPSFNILPLSRVPIGSHCSSPSLGL